MTKYEILDLRANYGERATSFVKFWLTITFGVFGAAYYGGNSLDSFSSISLLGFFAITSFLSALAIELNLNQITNLTTDIASLNTEPEMSDSERIDIAFSRTRFLVRGVQTLIAITYFGFCFYLFRGSL